MICFLPPTLTTHDAARLPVLCRGRRTETEREPGGTAMQVASAPIVKVGDGEGGQCQQAEGQSEHIISHMKNLTGKQVVCF